MSKALSAAGVAHRVQSAGSLFSVFFTEQQVVDYAGAQSQEAFRYKAFFHSMLSQGVYLPPSAFEAWFLSAAHDDAAISQVIDALPAAAAAAAAATPETRMSEHTVVHLLRHGEVHNPEGVLYGRLPGYRLSELGRAMAQRIAEHLATPTSPTSARPRSSVRRRRRSRSLRRTTCRSPSTDG